jgi:hypothetical protein
MRDHLNQAMGEQLFGVDFHDVLEKHEILDETELGTELGLTRREIEALKHRLFRG